MRIFRYLAAIFVTIILLMLARHLSLVRPVDIRYEFAGLTIEHRTVPKSVEGKPDKIRVKIKNSENKSLMVNLRWIETIGSIGDMSQYNTISMVIDDSGYFAAAIPPMAKGKKILYYIDIKDETGGLLARIPDDRAGPIKLKYEGNVPVFIVIPHIFLMFIAVYLASLALLDAHQVVSKGERLLSMGRNFKWATVAVFFGGYPFGWAMNHFAFGTIWEGIPFGWDFTDNKTQIVFLYLVFLNLSMLGTLYKNRFGGNHFSDKTLGRLAIIGFALVLTIYIIPHSIQFTIAGTALFSYGLTAVIVGLYTWGLTRRQKWTRLNRPK
jgi:hypothetical protein